MTIDQLYLVLALIMIFSLIFGSVYFIPIWITLLRSQIIGLKINHKQGRLLVKSHCVKKEFLIAIRDIWEIYPVQLDKLISHFHAGGNFKNLRIGIYEMTKRNKEPKINILTALDLANRDLKEMVEKAEKNNWEFKY